MSSIEPLEEYRQIIKECVKCGVCQAHCPAYAVGRREGDVARGKIALAEALLDGSITPEKRLEQDVGMCLMCGSCVRKCPGKVPTDDIVGAIRRIITDDKGLSITGKGVATLLDSPNLMNLAGKTAAFVSPLVLKKVPESSGLRLRLPSPLMKNRTVPAPAYRNFFERVDEFIPGIAGGKTIGFFPGCSLTYIFPEQAEQMVRILKAMGVSIFIPKKQGCCGIPARSTGNGELATRLADKNTQAFSGRHLDAIVTACGSCNAGIGEKYRRQADKYRNFADKVIDFSVFLEEEGLFSRLAAMKKWPNRRRITYHDPCHLKTQGITEAPRNLLRALPNVEFVEMAGADACCGLGGTFSVSHYEKSRAIGDFKMEGLLASGAEMVATGCPGCILQLQDSINHHQAKIRAVHLLEVLAQALKE